MSERDQVAIGSDEGYLLWCLDPGVERMTVHHIAALSNKRVDDVRFILSCEGVAVDYATATVGVRDLLEAVARDAYREAL